MSTLTAPPAPSSPATLFLAAGNSVLADPESMLIDPEDGVFYPETDGIPMPGNDPGDDWYRSVALPQK